MLCYKFNDITKSDANGNHLHLKTDELDTPSFQN